MTVCNCRFQDEPYGSALDAVPLREEDSAWGRMATVQALPGSPIPDVPHRNPIRTPKETAPSFEGRPIENKKRGGS